MTKRITRAVLTATVLASVAVALVGVTMASAAEPTASATQGVEASVLTVVGWGSANGCTQNLKTNNFGSLTPTTASGATIGAFAALPESEASTYEGAKAWIGCVTANTTIASVTAEGTSNMTNGADVLPLSDVAIGLLAAKQAGGTTSNGTPGCTVSAGQTGKGGCALEVGGSPSTLLSGAKEGTTEMAWQYQPTLPENQPAGTYTGGQVTFVASA